MMNITFTYLRLRSILLVVICAGLLAACATRSWQHESIDSAAFKSRAQTQDESDLRVTAAVPGESETEAIFGLPLYQRGIQPVWLEIENRSSFPVRYAPTGTDRNYFSPLEVAYVHRSGYTDEAREQMDRYFYQTAMPRLIPPGETRSGFVFTHARPGTKSFNVDLFGPDPEQDYMFTFFIDVPGFTPDHANVDFDTLYTEDEIRSLDSAGLRKEVAALPCCSSSDSSNLEDGDPVNVVLIGEGDDVLYALLGANWHEVAGNSDATPGRLHDVGAFLYGRRADASFYQKRADGRIELRLWLSPMQHNGKPVWVGQVSYYISNKSGDLSMDPNIDEASVYLLQNIWYSQSLLRYSMSASPFKVSIDKMRTDFRGERYFTTGYRVVMWISNEPVSLVDTVHQVWDTPDL